MYHQTVSFVQENPWTPLLATTLDTVKCPAFAVRAESSALVADIWAAAKQVAPMQMITNTIADVGTCQVLIGQHRFASKQAMAPNAAEWVVLVTSQPQHIEERIDVGLVRLVPQTFAVKETNTFHDIQMPMDKAQLLEHSNGGCFRFTKEQLTRVGDFWIASAPESPQQSPLAGTSVGIGGTVITHARTSRLLYRATTERQGHGAVLIP